MALYLVNNGSAVSAADVNQFTNLLNGTTTNTQLTVANRIRAQLTGTTTGTGGYVGETPSLSPPVSGTFIAGDFASDANGVIWVCKASGSPGTWSALPTLISAQTLGIAAASVTFSSIPAFNNISLMWKTRSSAAVAAEGFNLRFNGDSGSHYLWQAAQSNNATVTGNTSAGFVSSILVATITGASATASTWFSCGEFKVPYANDGTNFLVANGTASAFITSANSYTGTYGGQYNIAASMTSLTLFAATGNLVAGSKFSLYGWM